VRSVAQFATKKILVTGASGFIGSHLCRSLLEHGAEVHGSSRRPPVGGHDDVRWWQSDLTDGEAVRKLFSAIRPHYIFHLASYVSGSRSLEAVLPTFHNNLTSAVNILTAATKQGCHRIILAGSLEEPEPEEGRATPCSPYAAAKWSCSAYARMFYALYKTPVVVARLFMVYGPGQKDIQKLIPYVTLSLLRDESPRLSSGQRPVDWIYVNDVVDGLVAMADSANIEGRTIDLGSGNLVTIRDVVEQMVTLINPRIQPFFGAIPERPMEKVRVANTLQTYNSIAWRPKISIERGLELTIDWYRKKLKLHTG
jgi:UDP-glucose 4-epimerase